MVQIILARRLAGTPCGPSDDVLCNRKELSFAIFGLPGFIIGDQNPLNEETTIVTVLRVILFLANSIETYFFVLCLL